MRGYRYSLRDGKIVASTFLIFLALTLTTSAVFVRPARAETPPQIEGTETQITTDLADQFDPAISGNIISYTDSRGSDSDIWYYNLATSTEHSATTAAGDQLLSDVSNGIIVYEDKPTGSVFAYSTLTDQTRELAHRTKAWNPAIDQDLAAWSDPRDGNQEIYAMDLVTGEVRRITNSPNYDVGPDVNNGKIVWQSCDEVQCDIYCYDWASGTTRQITNTPAVSEKSPHIDGNSIVYQEEDSPGVTWGRICFFDLTTGVERKLSLPGMHRSPHISGDFVVFENLTVSTYEDHLWLWHLPTDSVFQVNVNPSSSQFLTDIDGNRIVYTDDRKGQLDIYMFTFNYDSTPPSITINSPTPRDYRSSETMTIDYTATDSQSGIKTTTATLDTTPVSNGQTIDLSTLGPGTHTLTVTATDNAGLTATQQVSFNIIQEITLTITVQGQQYTVPIETNGVITDAVVTPNTIHFKTSGESGKTYYVRITFPRVNTTEIKVFVDGVKLVPPPFPIWTTTSSYYIIYFEYVASTHAIAIEYATAPQPVGGYSQLTRSTAMNYLTPYLALMALITAVLLAAKHKKKHARGAASKKPDTTCANIN
jgi:beta propeller repeat protein